jgi:hypothetical protein
LKGNGGAGSPLGMTGHFWNWELFASAQGGGRCPIAFIVRPPKALP